QDNTAFTQSTTNETPIGCLYNTSYAAATSGRSTITQCDSNGRMVVVGAGTAGTATGCVATVQGVASMTPLLVNPGTATNWAVFADEGTFTAGTSNFGAIGGFFQTTATSNPLTTGQQGAVQLTVNRAMMVSPFSTAGVSLVGAAGAAAAGVTTVQGIASMTPVQVSQATASNLNATVVGLGSAGSASGGVLTVQGVASMTPFADNITQVAGSTNGVTVWGTAPTGFSVLNATSTAYPVAVVL